MTADLALPPPVRHDVEAGIHPSSCSGSRGSGHHVDNPLPVDQDMINKDGEEEVKKDRGEEEIDGERP